MTLRETIGRASAHILRRDAETLALHLLQRDRPWLLAHPEFEPPPAFNGTFDGLVQRRAAHEPLQYLTGHQEFFGHDLRVTPDVLIPRPETELLVEAVLEWARSQPQTPLRLVDVGTGSGAIAIALAANLPTASTGNPGPSPSPIEGRFAAESPSPTEGQIVTRSPIPPAGRIIALDLSPAALAVAQANAGRHGMEARISFRESDLLAALEPQLEAGIRFDAVVSNPPYVPRNDAPELQPEVRDFEPHLALFADENGLAIYRRLIPEAWQALRPGGLLALEFGFGQQPALAELLREWHAVRFCDDLAGIPRIALALRP